MKDEDKKLNVNTVEAETKTKVKEEEKPIPQFIGNNKAGDEKAGKSGDKSPDLKELLEKNLKWSQIIYEQNRRIIRRLFWSTLLAWFKWIVIIFAVAASIWYGYPYIKNLFNQYTGLLGQLQGVSTTTTVNLDQILSSMPLSQQQIEQIKAMSN